MQTWYEILFKKSNWFGNDYNLSSSKISLCNSSLSWQFIIHFHLEWVGRVEHPLLTDCSSVTHHPVSNSLRELKKNKKTVNNSLPESVVLNALLCPTCRMTSLSWVVTSPGLVSCLATNGALYISIDYSTEILCIKPRVTFYLLLNDYPWTSGWFELEEWKAVQTFI